VPPRHVLLLSEGVCRVCSKTASARARGPLSLTLSCRLFPLANPHRAGRALDPNRRPSIVNEARCLRVGQVQADPVCALFDRKRWPSRQGTGCDLLSMLALRVRTNTGRPGASGVTREQGHAPCPTGPTLGLCLGALVHPRDCLIRESYSRVGEVPL